MDIPALTVENTFDLKQGSEEPLSYTAANWFCNLTDIDSKYKLIQIEFEGDEMFQSDGDLESGYVFQQRDATTMNDIDDPYEAVGTITPLWIDLPSANAIEEVNTYVVAVKYYCTLEEIESTGELVGIWSYAQYYAWSIIIAIASALGLATAGYRRRRARLYRSKRS